MWITLVIDNQVKRLLYLVPLLGHSMSDWWPSTMECLLSCTGFNRILLVVIIHSFGLYPTYLSFSAITARRSCCLGLTGCLKPMKNISSETGEKADVKCALWPIAHGIIGTVLPCSVLTFCFSCQGQWWTSFLFTYAWPQRRVWWREYRHLCQIFQGRPFLPCSLAHQQRIVYLCTRHRAVYTWKVHLYPKILYEMLFRRRRKRERGMKGVNEEEVNEKEEREALIWVTICNFSKNILYSVLSCLLSSIWTLFSGWQRWSCGLRWRSESQGARRWVTHALGYSLAVT